MTKKPDIENEKKFHDDYFGEHNVRKIENQFYDDLSKSIILNDIFGRLGRLTGKKVLYYGCGENVSVYERMLQQGADVYLFDISIVALQNIRKKYPLVKAVVMDAHQLAFLKDQFDVILGRGILHHLELVSSLEETKRILKDGGETIFIEPLDINPVISLYRALTPKSRTPDETPFRLKQLRVIADSYPECEYRFYFFLTLFATALKPAIRNLKIWNPVFKFFHSLDQGLFRILPFLKYLSWIGVIYLRK